MDRSSQLIASAAVTPTQSSFTFRRRTSLSLARLQLSPARRRFSFLSLTPSPGSPDSFTRLIDIEPSDDHQRRNTFCLFDQLSPTIVTKCKTPPPNKVNSLFTLGITKRFPMPSWSMSSKSSSSSKSSTSTLFSLGSSSSSKSSKPKVDVAKSQRRYGPAPFFQCVAEHQFIYGGNEKSAIRAILRERNLDLSVEEAEIVFGQEEVVGPRFDLIGMIGYMPDRNSRCSSDGSDDDSIMYSPTPMAQPSFTSNGRRRPAPLQLNAPYMFEGSDLPSSSAASFDSAATSVTLVPSIQESCKSPKSSVRSMFKLGRK